MQVFVSIQKIKKLSKLISSNASAFERFLVMSKGSKCECVFVA